MTWSTADGRQPPSQCPHCGFYHTGVCSMIKAVEYYQDGRIKRVEYHEPKAPKAIIDWPIQGTVQG